MPTRILREGILSSSRIDALTPGAELFYRRLMTVADDYGRYYASPVTLRGACWPLSPEKVTERQVAQWLSECISGDNPLLSVYTVAGCRYLQIHDFGQQTRGKSKFPSMPNCLANDNQLLSNHLANDKQMCSLVGVGVGVEGGVVVASPKSGSAQTAHGSRFSFETIPDEWAEFSRVDCGWPWQKCEQVFASFADYWRASAGAKGRKADWFATWRNWCRREQEGVSKSQQNGSRKFIEPEKPQKPTWIDNGDYISGADLAKELGI